MKEPTSVHETGRVNRTGLGVSSHAERMLEVPDMTTPNRDGRSMKDLQEPYLKETRALGTMPTPVTVKGVARAVGQALKGNRTVAFTDRIGERLAFERTGVRLYEGLLDKLEAETPFENGPSRDEVEAIRDEELEHALMLTEALRDLGADPTALTPSADLVSVEGMGLGAVIGDPRTSVGQCLHALLTAELADGEGWTLLRILAEELGHKDLELRFRDAEEDEERHLTQVRSWLTAHARVETGLS
jgi:rubrerythrin